MFSQPYRQLDQLGRTVRGAVGLGQAAELVHDSDEAAVAGCGEATVGHLSELGVDESAGSPVGGQRQRRPLRNRWGDARANALPTWLHFYHHHRDHTAVGGSPATRVPNLSGQST